jgi:hypothetical protein
VRMLAAIVPADLGGQLAHPRGDLLRWQQYFALCLG